MQWLVKLWYKETRFKWFQRPLIPLSYVYQGIMWGRHRLYRLGWLSRYTAPVPVIIVGNLTTGGVGKTPLTAALVIYLQSLGYKPGIVSRGYKAQGSSWPKYVSASSTAAQVGDEPLMLFHQTGAPVAVDPNRVRAVKLLLAKTECDVVVSDDGLQHLKLNRDVEIAVIDGERKFGTGFCLPAGPLREGVGRLKEVDYIFSQEKTLRKAYKFSIEVEGFYCVTSFVRINPAVRLMQSTKVHAAAGIGNPSRFFNLLISYGFEVEPHAFRDHYHFSPKDFTFLRDSELVIMTEKDAVKCVDFADERFIFVRIRAKLQSTFYSNLRQRLNLRSTY